MVKPFTPPTPPTTCICKSFTSVAACPQISTVGPNANEDRQEPGNILPIKLKKESSIFS